ncbi:S24/S26 family peptidase [Deinococcus sp. HMF7604]|uniref:S24 family peptidase n=1 Tax=Deinococcus betulae TaxID=2873312 RepID=UPI001CCECAD8|nr:S24/S26 family peptidase [Deinococcus betulae]MBZ9752766.1 S24/S26 family peptidase [Deinococcus betulae]
MQTYFLARRYAPSKATLVGSVSAGTLLDPNPFTSRKRFNIPVPFRRFEMFVLQVDGDSMTLPDGTGLTHGAYVLVNRREILTERGYVFAFRLADGTHVVKRLQLFNGRPAMWSDNTEYEPVQLTSSVRNCGHVYAMSLDGVAWTSTGYRGTGRAS